MTAIELGPVNLYKAPHDMAAGEVADIIDLFNPRENEGFLDSPEQLQQAAFEALPSYQVRVVRRSSRGKPEELDFGTFYEESVRFSDGAVRLVTIGKPNPHYFGHDEISPNVIVSGDPYGTGPNGLNNDKIKAMVELGYHVVWPHHQGRHSVWPTTREHRQTLWRFLSSKSVGKTAHQDHALLNDMAPNADFETDDVNIEGYSRSSMKGKAFIALARLYGRHVIYADLDAPCFAHEASPVELLTTFAKQLPHEAKGMGRLAEQVSTLGAAMGNPKKLREYAGTLDVHPLNLLHELAWMRPLINGDSGTYGEAMPLDSVGVTTLFSEDYMSQAADWRRIHANRPGMAILDEPGPHLAGAWPENLQKKYERFARLQQVRIEKGMSLTGLTIEDIVPSKLSLVA